MPEVNEVYSHYSNMELVALHEERNTIMASAPGGDYTKLEDEALTKLLAIGRALRTKTAHANSGSKKRATSKAAPSALEDLI